MGKLTKVTVAMVLVMPLYTVLVVVWTSVVVDGTTLTSVTVLLSVVLTVDLPNRSVFVSKTVAISLSRPRFSSSSSSSARRAARSARRSARSLETRRKASRRPRGLGVVVGTACGPSESAAAVTSVGWIVHQGSRVRWRRGTLQVLVLVLVTTVGSTLKRFLVTVPRVFVLVVVVRFGVIWTCVRS